MKGLEITVIAFSQIRLGDRADAEYYSKEGLRIASELREHAARPLDEFCDMVVSAFYPAATDLYAIGDTPFVRCVDCIKFPLISKLQDEQFERIPRSFAEEHASVHFAHQGDIVLTKVGTPCYASVIHDYDEVALSRTVMGLVNIRDISPYYLMAFLRSRYGFNQLMRQRELTIQYQLTLDRVRDVRVYSGTKQFRDAIESAVLIYFDLSKRSIETYAQAERTLLAELGLLDWQPPEPLSYTRKASEAFAAERLDAERFHPKFSAAKKALQQAGATKSVRLESLLIDLTNGHTPLRHDLEIGEVPFLCAEHIGDFRINYNSDKHVLQSHHETVCLRTQLKNGHVLMTIKGRVGNVAIVEDLNIAANINQDVALLQFNDQLPLWYVVAFLNSQFGKLMIEEQTSGQINPFLSLGNLRYISVPVFGESLMNHVADRTKMLVHQGLQAEKDALNGLERAKRAVEIAIEDSEAAALTFLDHEGMLVS